jgi:hypothetical protein
MCTLFNYTLYTRSNIHKTNYLVITAFPPKKNLIPRFEGRKNQTIRFGDWLEGSLENFVEDKILFPKLLLLRCGDPTKSCTS